MKWVPGVVCDSKDASNSSITLWQDVPSAGPGQTRDEYFGTLLAFFKETFDICPTIIGIVTTLPTQYRCNPVPNTGGRHDLFFYLSGEDSDKGELGNRFCNRKAEFGIRWWGDIFIKKGVRRTRWSRQRPEGPWTYVY